MNKLLFQNKEITKFLIESPKYGNFEILVDTNDWEKIKLYRWRIVKKRKDFYVICHYYLNKKRIALAMTRFIFSLFESKNVIDHINHNTLDNRKQNLRICTRKENSRNRKLSVRNTSGYKGVFFSKQTNKWLAHIGFNNKKFILGRFDNIIDAVVCYNNKAKELFGEFAYLNKI